MPAKGTAETGQVVPKQRRSIKSRRSILAAAERVFAEKGLHGGRVDEIARLAGLNKQRLYAYFGSKRELYRHVLLQVYSRVAENERLTALREEDIPKMTGVVVDAFFEFHEKNPRFWRMLAWENLQGGQGLLEGDWARIRGTYIRHLEELYGTGQREGVFRSDVSFETYILLLFAATSFYFSNQLTISRLLNVRLSSSRIRRKFEEELGAMLARSLYAGGS
ncbi:MAG: TetR family transcriptional regulator [Kiritimatiellae bacterium]|nr:TetR family transcriptional regulator [Kiritimatiellia bacterium]